MYLMQSGVNLSVIAIWLGHESIETTHQYLEADLALKRQALESVAPPDRGPRPVRCQDSLLRFLEAL